jgi:hypothetical protein
LKKVSTILIYLVFPLLCSCNYFKKNKEEDKGKPIAKVKDTILYSKDLEGILPSDIKGQDSIDFVKRYAELWVRKELLFSRAITFLSTKENEEIEEVIEEKIKEYRYSLYTSEFEKQLVEQKLDTVITDKEIEEYYKNNPANFSLKQNIVRCLYLKVPLDAPKIDKPRYWIKSDKEKDKKELSSYALQYAGEYNLEADKWIDFDLIVAGSPLRDLPNRTEFISKNKYFETKDDSFLYLFYFLEYKISNQISPLEFVRKRVKDIILNQRKRKFVQELEQSIFEKARESNEFQLYL